MLHGLRPNPEKEATVPKTLSIWRASIAVDRHGAIPGARAGARFFSSTAGNPCNRVAGACYEKDRDLREHAVPLSARANLPTPTDLYQTYLPASGDQR